eukprot:COSAG01_NODE_10618_length_2120_cov_12.414646_2_plen_92_part_00
MSIHCIIFVSPPRCLAHVLGAPDDRVVVCVLLGGCCGRARASVPLAGTKLMFFVQPVVPTAVYTPHSVYSTCVVGACDVLGARRYKNASRD